MKKGGIGFFGWVLIILGIALVIGIIGSSLDDEEAAVRSNQLATTATTTAAATLSEDGVWLGKYSTRVKERIDLMDSIGDCLDLQREFDIAFENDSITRARHGTGSEDLLQYIDGALNTTGCYGTRQIYGKGWCNRMRLGVDPAELWLEIGHMHGQVEEFTIKAELDMGMCPEQKENPKVIKWLEDCGFPMRTEACKHWADPERPAE
jgi:hypothetical protein